MQVCVASLLRILLLLLLLLQLLLRLTRDIQLSKLFPRSRNIDPSSVVHGLAAPQDDGQIGVLRESCD